MDLTKLQSANCTIGIATKMGANYEFPDMRRDEVFKVIGPQLYLANDLVLVNVSGACLTVPIRIIDSIALDGEVIWRAAERP